MSQQNNIASVIGPQFISPNQQEVIVDIYTIGTLVVTDINHKNLIKVKPCDSRFHHQRVLLDPNDKPIAFMRTKNMTLHETWNVFGGESKDNSDMIFSTKKENMILQLKTNLKVLLANKVSNKDDCDFWFKGNWSKRNCTLYKGDSSTVIANMRPLLPLENTKYSKDKFMVAINPNVDYAFVITLIAIVDAMENPHIKQATGVGGGFGTAVDVINAIASS